MVAAIQLVLVGGRAYPLFGLLFGYGIVQLTRRRAEVGTATVTRLVRRRGRWMLVIGLVHGVLLWAGDIVGAYGLLAVRLARREHLGPVTAALQACGQRSLSCYLAQSVAFVAFLPAWTFGVGARIGLWQAALVGLGAWAVILAVATWSARVGHRGLAEILLRRLTYPASRRFHAGESSPHDEASPAEATTRAPRSDDSRG